MQVQSINNQQPNFGTKKVTPKRIARAAANKDKAQAAYDATAVAGPSVALVKAYKKLVNARIALQNLTIGS